MTASSTKKNTNEKSLSIKDRLEVLRKVVNTQTVYDCNALIDEIEVEVEKYQQGETKCK